MDRACLEDRAAIGLTTCPGCSDQAAFSELSERFGIWFRDSANESALVTAGAGGPSPTITYLMESCINSPLPSVPLLVTNKLSPMQQHLAAQKSPRIKPVLASPLRSLRCDEPIVILTATRSPTKAMESGIRYNDTDCDVICTYSSTDKSLEKGWLSTPGVSSSKKFVTTARKTKSLPSKMSCLKSSTNSLISTFFKPVSRLSDPSESEQEVGNKSFEDMSTKDTSSKDTSAKPTRSSSPVKSPSSPIKKPTTPFKTIRMCTTSSPVKTKIVRPMMKIEFSSDTGTEGPLSDIDDILTGSIPDLGTHPLANIVFNQSNPHLKDIMKRISGLDDDEDTKVEAEPEKNRKERKKVEKKPKAEGLQKKVLKKVHSDSDSGNTRRKIIIQKLPLSSRQIYHGRNWVPVSVHGEEEDECECSWVMDYTGKKLEDIIDLNSGEKTMMNLWNKHVNKYQVIIVLPRRSGL
jgi:hypothetical protein